VDTSAKKMILLPGIEVVEPKTSSTTALDFSPNTIIEQQQIQTIHPKQLSEILIFSPGVNIQNQGGLESMKTISIRGMGSMRSLIMLDGMPLNSAQNASFDLNNIDVSLIDNVEIIRGGSSSIFGGNAIGGSVNIITETAYSEKLLMKGNLSYGSFNEIGLGAMIKAVGCSMTFNWTSSNGNYPFTFSQFGEEKKYYRENADYDNGHISFLGKFNISDWVLIARYTLSMTNKGVPGAVLQGQVNHSNARLEDNNHILFLNSSCIFDSSDIKISYIYKHNNTLFNEPDNSYDNSSIFISDDIMLNGKYNFNLFGIQNEGLFSLSYSTLDGDMFDPTMNRNVARGLVALGYRLEKDFLIYNNLLRFNLSGRYDKGISKEKNTDKSVLTGGFGIIFALKYVPLSLRTNISHDFRFPNFNEMYYRNYGTKDLLPEKSNNINVGVDYKLFDIMNISLDGFYSDVIDMITAIPTSPISWSAKNISRAESYGTEVAISLLNGIKINKIFSINNISISYTLQRNLDKSIYTKTYNNQLLYIPNELSNVLISFKVFGIMLGGKIEYSSHRYYQADNSINSVIPSYFIGDLFAVYDNIKFTNAPLKFNIRLDIKNIFDTQYTIINNYIMPRRQFRLSLGVVFEY
jgi:outer membrane cobalamin receptor